MMQEKPSKADSKGLQVSGEDDRLRKRSVLIAGHKTSLSLEPVFWRALKQAAAEEAVSINKLVEHIDRQRRSNLSSAVRVFLFKRYRSASDED